MKKSAVLIFILSIIGVFLSAYSLYLHQQNTSTFCHFSATFNCDIVNQGIYSEIEHIPVAALGIFGYLVLAVGSLLLHKQKMWFLLTLIAALIGLGFALYLTSIEAFVLKTYCLVCLASQVDILALCIVLVASKKSYTQRV